jgi:hypothetical protein
MATAISSSNSKIVSTTQETPPLFHSRFTTSPKDLLALNKRYESLWATARTIALLGSFALVIAGGAFITAWNPETIFYFSIGASVGLSSVGSIISYIDDKITSYHLQVEKYTRISAIYENIIKKGQWGLEHSMHHYDIPYKTMNDYKKQDPKLHQFAKGLAYLLYTNETSLELQKQHLKFKDLAHKETQPGKKRSYAYSAARCELASYISRIHAAYDLALLKNPFFSKSLDELGLVKEVEPQNLWIDRTYGNVQEMFYFNNSKKPPITYSNLTSSLNQLVYNSEGGAIRELSELADKLTA